MTDSEADADKALWAALERLDDDLLDPNMPEEEIAEDLRQMGLNPEALAEKGRQLGHAMTEKRRLAWQDQARAKQRGLQQRADLASKIGDMSRQQMLARLDELRAVDPQVGTAIRAAARKRRPEESSDEDLRSLLEDMEALRAIEKGSQED
jgi:hypothetical protein